VQKLFSDRYGRLCFLLFYFRAPPDEIHKDLKKRRYWGKCEDEYCVPCDRRREVEKDDKKSKPESGTPRAAYKRAERAEKRIRICSDEPMTDEPNNDVIREELNETLHSERHEEKINERYAHGEPAIRCEPEVAENGDYHEEK